MRDIHFVDDFIVAVDEKMLEFVSTKDFESFPRKLKFKSKIETDFMIFAKQKL